MKKTKRLLLILFVILLLMQCFDSPVLTGVYALELTAPVNFDAEVFQNYIALNWKDNNDAFYYTVIEKSVDQGYFYSIATLHNGNTAYKDHSISNGHIYTYRARTFHGSVKSPYTAEVEAITLCPANFTITQSFSNQVDLEWDYPSIFLLKSPKYETIIERRLSGKSTWTRLTTLPIAETTYRDTTVSADSVYYYRIRTRYSNGTYSYYVPSNSGLSTRTAYPLTTHLSGYALSDTQIKLEWDMTQSDGGEAILQKQNTAGDFYTIYTSESRNTYIDSSLTKGDTYTYRLMMKSENGIHSEFTEEVSIITGRVPIPLDLSVSALSADRIVLFWSYPYEVETGFEVWRMSSGTWEHLATLSKNVENFTDTSAISGQSYSYKVRSMRGETAFSAFSQFKTVTNTYPATPGKLVYYTSQGALHLYSAENVPVNTTYTLEIREGLNGEWLDFESYTKGTLIEKVSYTNKSEYHLRLRANLGSLTSYSPELIFFGSAPDPVQNLKSAINGSDRVLLTWEDMGNKEEGYHVYRIVNGKKSLLSRLERDVALFTDEQPISGSVSQYEVVAYNASGVSAARAITVTVPKILAYKDIASYKWAHDAIYTLSGLGALEYQNGYFAPEKPISKGQLARLILRSFDIPNEPQGLFTLTDLSPNHAYYHDLMTAVNLGLLHADTQGRIDPDKAVTRREIILFLNNTLNILDTPLNTYPIEILQNYTDYEQVTAFETPIMASFVGDGIITGKSGKLLSLSSNASKVEGVVIIYRTLLKYLP